MRFADPHACPSCGGAIAGDNQCPHCRFVLGSTTSLQLWRTLQQADELLEQARLESTASAASPLGTPTPMPPPTPMPTAPRREPSVTRRWSTGSIILGLGALCLIIAALVFVTVSWSVLGATGRTFVLLVITLAVCAGAVLVTRKRLRASAEALWAVFFGLFSIDYFAARSYGLFGLDSIDLDPTMLAYGLTMALGGAGVALAARRSLPVLVPSLAAGLGVWVSSFWLCAMVDFSFFWSVFAGLALTVVAAGLARIVSLMTLTVLSGLAAACYYVVAVGGAIYELDSGPRLSEVTAGGHGIAMLVMVALTACVGIAFKRLAIPAAALATWGITALVFVPAAAESDQVAFLVISIVVVALAGALVRGTNPWIRGARIGSLAVTGVLGLASLGWLANALSAVAESDRLAFSQEWDARLANNQVLPGEGWLAFVVFGALAIAVFATQRWPEAGDFAKPLSLTPAAVAAVGLAVGVIALEPPVLVAAVVVLAIGMAFLLLGRSTHEAWLAVGLVVVVLPVGMTLASQQVTLGIWIAVAAVLIGVAMLAKPLWAGLVASGGATALMIGSSAVAADLGSMSELGVRLIVIVVSLAAIVLASFALGGFIGREAIEAVGGLGLAATLASSTELGLGQQALLWTVAGVVLVMLSLFIEDRRFLRYLGVAALGVGWILRLVASDVETVEAYTAPFALVLLGAGLLAMKDNPRLRTAIALTPGLTLAFLPSLPQALDTPTGLRALVLGLAALLALAVGVWRKWQMPFLFGTVVVALLVLWNVGPLANGLPRWTLIATAGIVLVGSGITWENRVKNARSATEFVQNLK